MARVDTLEFSRWIKLARESNYRAEQMAAKMGISVRQLERRSRDLLGLTPTVLLNQQRFIAAGRMLKKRIPVHEVAEDLGFSQISNFSREFRRVYGAPPRVFCKLTDSEKAAWIQAALEVSLPKNRAITECRPVITDVAP